MIVVLSFCAVGASFAAVDVTEAVVVVRTDASRLERTAATVLTEEVETRTGMHWPVTTEWPESGPVVIVAAGTRAVSGRAAPAQTRLDKPEGYSIATDLSVSRRPVVWIAGADGRGALYGVGRLLRELEWAKGLVRLAEPVNLTTAPAYPIRGHQLGYRARANSYDAWDVAQYDQYIRELALFGANCIENIPFEDDRPSPVMKLDRPTMNRAMSEICDRYGMDYWVWSPAPFDLSDQDKRTAHLETHRAFFAECPRLDAVFFPGGDPGDNHPSLVMPFLEELAQLLAVHHPEARVWISLQGFDAERVDWFHDWLAEHTPDWLGGVVAGPSSPPIPETRERLPKGYQLRSYPDITHTVRCQYPTPWLDPAIAFTLGREPVNPEPIRYARIHNVFAPYTDGFLAYSDGIHDDVNKAIWSAIAWDPESDPRQVLVEYCRLFFGPDVAQEAADGILALERNWQGPVATNGGVDATLAFWQALEGRAPALLQNWRWQLCLLRAYYDAYTRHRLLYETALAQEAYDVLASASTIGADPAVERAAEILARAETRCVRPELRGRVIALCARLFDTIGLQTSVKMYHASGGERGAVLDYLDVPLNNRWWLEDEFVKVLELSSEADKVARLDEIRTWEQPGPGCYYDDIGNVAKSPHVIRGELFTTDPDLHRSPNPDSMWWDNGFTRTRRSWITYMDWPLGLRYEGLDPEADYVVRTTGNGDCLLRVDDLRVEPTLNGRELGEIKEFPVPKESYEDQIIVLTFDRPHEPGINWRQASRLTEVWLIKY